MRKNRLLAVILTVMFTFSLLSGITLQADTIGKEALACFLQVKIPHFCKCFSPGTGGEFLC